MSFTGDGYLEEIARQLGRIANSLEALDRNFEAGKVLNVRTVIEECPVIKIRSN